MKATGIVRRIDDLGRVVIPKEIRRTLRIHEGDPLEIYTDRQGEVILKKYSPISELNEFAGGYAEAASSVLGCAVAVTDTDQVIAVSGGPKKDLIDKRIHPRVEQVIFAKNAKKFGNDDVLVSITADGRDSSFNHQIVVPIVVQGDPIGSVILLSKDRELSMSEQSAAEIGATFLARQMDN